MPVWLQYTSEAIALFSLFANFVPATGWGRIVHLVALNLSAAINGVKGANG